MVLEFFYSLVQSATQAIPVHVLHFHWFKGHMAAYIRPRAVLVRKEPQNQCQVTNRIKLSLSIQLDQNHNKLRKIEEHRAIFSQTLTFFRIEFKQIQWNPWQFSEIQSWTFIIEPFSSTIQARSHRRVWEEEGKKFKEFEPVKKKKENYRFIFGFKPRNRQTKPNSRVLEDSSSNLRLKHR